MAMWLRGDEDAQGERSSGKDGQQRLRRPQIRNQVPLGAGLGAAVSSTWHEGKKTLPLGASWASLARPLRCGSLLGPPKTCQAPQLLQMLLKAGNPSGWAPNTPARKWEVVIDESPDWSIESGLQVCAFTERVVPSERDKAEVGRWQETGAEVSLWGRTG